MKLVIFDIDLTLVDIMEYHLAAAARIFKEFFDVEASLKEIDFVGRTFHDNMSELGKLHGISQQDVDKNNDEMAEKYEQYVIEAMKEDCSAHVLPGVIAVLEKLNNKNHFLAVVTGNNHELADQILKRSGLKEYFHVLVTGDIDDNRSELVHKAILASEKITGEHFSEVVIFGDSIYDIDSGKPHKAKTIAVCTGFHSEEKLQSHNPTFIFKDLSQIDKVLEAVDHGN